MAGRENAGSGEAAAGREPVVMLPTGGVLAVAPELDLVSGLLAVFAAIFPEPSLRFDNALTGWVRAFRC